MAVITSRNLNILVSQLVLLHSVIPQVKTGVYFKLIKGPDKESRAGDTVSLICKEFFQCGREQSCTHVMQLSNKYVVLHGSEELRKRKGSAVRIYEKVRTEGSSFFQCHQRVIKEQMNK